MNVIRVVMDDLDELLDMFFRVCIKLDVVHDEKVADDLFLLLLVF